MERSLSPKVFIEKRDKVYLVSINEPFVEGKDHVCWSINAIRSVLTFISNQSSVRLAYQLSLPYDDIKKLGQPVYAYHIRTLERMRIMGRVLSEM